jgi:hypothetical protein
LITLEDVKLYAPGKGTTDKSELAHFWTMHLNKQFELTKEKKTKYSTKSFLPGKTF